MYQLVAEVEAEEELLLVAVEVLQVSFIGSSTAVFACLRKHVQMHLAVWLSARNA